MRDIQMLNAIKLERYFHWALQILPPLSLLFIISRHGPGMWFLLMVPGLCFLVSVISLAAKSFNLRRNRDRIVRPTLTIAVSVSLFFLATYTYSNALKQSQVVFEALSKDCVSVVQCTPDLSSWELRFDGRYSRTVGEGITYPLFYSRLDNGFRLQLAESLDLGDEFVKEW